MDKSMEILGLPIHPVTMEEALKKIILMVEGEKPSLVFTPNPELLVMAKEDSTLKGMMEKADLLLPDGTGILLAGRLLGYPLKERVTGIDLLQELLKVGHELDFSFYFLGGRPGIAEKAMERVKGDYPKLRILGCHHGYLKGEEKGVVREIIHLKPQILLVGMGAPRQETFLYHYNCKLPIKVGITVGGSFDVLAGELKRAPSWMMRLNLEWLFRLFQEPSRWRRMLALPYFLYLVLKERIRNV